MKKLLSLLLALLLMVSLTACEEEIDPEVVLPGDITDAERAYLQQVLPNLEGRTFGGFVEAKETDDNGASVVVREDRTYTFASGGNLTVHTATYRATEPVTYQEDGQVKWDRKANQYFEANIQGARDLGGGRIELLCADSYIITMDANGTPISLTYKGEVYPAK